MEPELPLQAEAQGAQATVETKAVEAATETKPGVESEPFPPIGTKALQETLEGEPKPALPMKTAPSWAQTNPPDEAPVAVEDETEPKPAVPMQKPAPSWAQTSSAPVEAAGDPEPSPSSPPARSAPLTWPPKAQPDTPLPTQSDIWPPEPPTEHTMPAWPPSAFADPDSQLPDLPAGPTPSEWKPAPVAPRPAPTAGSGSPASTAPAPATSAPAASAPPAPVPLATVPPATVPPATVPSPTKTVPPATVPPTAAVPTKAVPAANVPPTVAAPAKTVPPAAPPEPEPATKTVPPIAAKPDADSSASTPATAAAPTAQSEPKGEGPQPRSTAVPAWAPNITQPAAPSPEQETQWPAVVDIPAWAPQTHVASARPAAAAPTPQPPTPPAAKPPAPVAPAQPPAPAAANQASAPGAAGSTSSSSWQVVDQKHVEVNINRVVPTPEDRSYAEWFAWAKRGGAPVPACHAAAQAAFAALSSGKDVAAAAQIAAAAMASPPLAVEVGRQTYCAWFALANIDLNLDQARAHLFATAALHALGRLGGGRDQVASGRGEDCLQLRRRLGGHRGALCRDDLHREHVVDAADRVYACLPARTSRAGGPGAGLDRGHVEPGLDPRASSSTLLGSARRPLQSQAHHRPERRHRSHRVRRLGVVNESVDGPSLSVAERVHPREHRRDARGAGSHAPEAAPRSCGWHRGRRISGGPGRWPDSRCAAGPLRRRARNASIRLRSLDSHGGPADDFHARDSRRAAGGPSSAEPIAWCAERDRQQTPGVEALSGHGHHPGWALDDPSLRADLHRATGAA